MTAITYSDKDIISLVSELNSITEHWKPTIINQQGFQFRIVKFQGEFTWHAHDASDKVAFVVDGEMRVDFKNGQNQETVFVKAGEMYVLPKQRQHKPSSVKECSIVLIEIPEEA